MGSQVATLLRNRGRRLGGRALLRATRVALVLVVLVANAVGAVIVFALAALVLPGLDSGDESTVRIVNAGAALAYLLVSIVAGFTLGFRYAKPVERWLAEERDPDEVEQRRALRGPLVVFALTAIAWALAAVVFGAINLSFSAELAIRMAIVIALGGVTTSAIAYLLSERVTRPLAIRALAIGPPPRSAAPGVVVRFVLSWSIGSAVPVIGIMLIGLEALLDDAASRRELALTMVALGAVALGVGLLAVLVAARAIAGPVRSVRRAVRDVERGDFDVEVRVDDGSELGRLQAGVNRMVTGLREREELRDLFGRHVGEDVARAALERGVELGGETRDVAVLFVDVIGSTRLASERPPHDVVELLNRFFDVIIDVVGEHGGWVNKFEGDGALVIFGAPAPVDTCAAAALAAARDLGRRLAEDVPDLAAGVGVSAGEAVAGNIGSTERFEYTVIGDPVNEAARLSDLAKGLEGRVAAAARILERDDAEKERTRWREDGEVELRGRDAPTRIAVPV